MERIEEQSWTVRQAAEVCAERTDSTREMPIWSREFFGDAPPMPPNLVGVKRRLMEVLAGCLETLQTERQL